MWQYRNLVLGALCIFVYVGAEVMAGDSRSKILDEVFNRMPTLFRADKAGNTSAGRRWRVTSQNAVIAPPRTKTA